MTENKSNESLHAGNKIVKFCILANAILFAVEYKDPLVKVCKKACEKVCEKVSSIIKNRNHESRF